MESRKSKKTKSYGEPSKGSRDLHAARAAVSSSRPGLTDRTYSAPLVARVSRDRHDGRSQKTLKTAAQQASSMNDGIINDGSPPSTSTVSQPSSSPQPSSASRNVSPDRPGSNWSPLSYLSWSTYIIDRSTKGNTGAKFCCARCRRGWQVNFCTVCFGPQKACHLADIV